MYLTGIQPFKEITSFRIKSIKCTSNKKHDSQQISPNLDVLCPLSFFEAVENLKKNDFANTLKLLGPIPKRNWNAQFNITNYTLYKKSKKVLEWFSKSKLNSSNTTSSQMPLPQIKMLERKIVNHVLFSSNIHLPLGYQIRGFKTENSIKLEKNRKLIYRLQSFCKTILFGESHVKTVETKTESTHLPSKTIKDLLQDSSMTLENKEKIKAAFAEGYLAQERPKTSSLYRWIRLFAVVAVIHTLFFYLIVSSNSTMLGLSKDNVVNIGEIKVTFNDVKGVEEAKAELKDVVQFLKNPEKFTALGAKLPRGVLLVGPPGTGKTLLARAVAGEAGVPFFHTAGPEFDEVLVGQGARRVRDLFKAAKERAPCVVFIDEIDSVGSKRTNSVFHPYANQTINQLLTEMDGFEQVEGVIVLGATNRKDELDPALLRPGRFDIEVTVPVPDLSGRKDILSLYLSRIKSNDGIDLEVLARGTTGFTGADLHNMVNQAALRAAIDDLPSVNMNYLENARDKILMGPERKSRIPDEETNIITAYHESGHAVVAYFTAGSNPLHKVTIIPRGQSLGHTAYIPEKETYHVTKSQLLAMMDTMMGGRAAEEMIFGPDKITSGASSDLKQATGIATQMVKEWGMSEKAGLRTFNPNNDGLGFNNGLSFQNSEKIDSEIQRLLQESYLRAKAILETHKSEHKFLAEALLKYETLDAKEIEVIMKTKSPFVPLKKSFIPFSTKSKKS